MKLGHQIALFFSFEILFTFEILFYYIQTKIYLILIDIVMFVEY